MRKALFFLSILTDADVDWLSRAGKRVDVLPGTVLIHEDRPIENVYFVLDGALVVVAAGRSIARLRAGEIVGEISFVDTRPPLATVRADEKAVVLAVPRSALVAKLEEAPFAARFYHALSMFLADRLRQTVGQLGYGHAREEPAGIDTNEIEPQLLRQVTLAGARFDWLVKRLGGA